MALRQFLTATRVLIILALLTGVVYPASVTLAAHLALRSRAEGSLLLRGDRIVGSKLIGQAFASPRYFWGRPSATATPYDASASSGSNLGPSSRELRSRVEERVSLLRASDPSQAAPIPVDLVTASASGLDPHISPAAARWQAPRVARERGLPVERVFELVNEHVEGRTLGLFGEPRINVLLLNLALDELR